MIIELILTNCYTKVYDTKYFPISNFNTYVCLQFGSFSFIIYCIHSLNLCLFMWSPFIPTPLFRVSVMSARWGSGFLLRILCCSQSGNHPENNWAKFGYILHFKVDPQKKKNRILLYYSCLRTETYHKKSGFFFREIFEIWQIWVIFPMKNPMYRLKSYFSSRNLAKIRQ
jgi:hypothetical protein